MIALVFSSAAMFIESEHCGKPLDMLKEAVLLHWILFYRLKIAFLLDLYYSVMIRIDRLPLLVSWWSLLEKVCTTLWFILSLKKSIWILYVVRLFLVCFSGFYGRNVALVLLLLSLQVFTLFTVYLVVAWSSVWLSYHLGGYLFSLKWNYPTRSCELGFILFL